MSPADAVSSPSADLRADIDRVFRAQKSHSAGPPLDLRWRRERLDRLEDWVLANRHRIRQALEADFSKPESETDVTEVLIPLMEIRHTRRNLRRWMRPQAVPGALAMLGTRGYVRYDPRGTVLILTPFNYPFLLAVEPLVAAIAAGNRVVLKPSELAPDTALLLADMVSTLFEEDQVAVFNGDAEVATLLLSRPFDHIYFTGSQRVGSIVMRAAAEHHATITLELGGKSPTLLDETTDLQTAAQRIAWAKFGNSGHTCVAPDYLLVPRQRVEETEAALASAITACYGATPEERHATPDLGRIIDDLHFDRLLDLLDRSLEAGARLSFGGQRERGERYLEPTVLCDVDGEMPIMQEEIFGPVLPILAYDSLDEALDGIAGRGRPLSLYIFSKDRDRIRRVLDRTESGNVCINDCAIQYLHRNLPFGGLNTSGQGAAHGWYGFREMSHERAVVKRGWLDPLRWLRPPYGPRVKRLLDAAIRWL